jgi:Leucine-rich repeat (LRR) protein
LAEDREALRAMREVDAAIDTLLEKALANLKIEIDHELGGGNDTWVAVVGSGLKVPPAHVVRGATISGHWRDQGYGNQKGRVRLVLLRDGALVAESALPGLAPHGKEPFSLELDLRVHEVQAGDVVEVQIIVGGGGGHKLELRGVELVLDAVPTEALVKSGVVETDGRVTQLSLYECESLAALPPAICGLLALTRLTLERCSGLRALPDAISELSVLAELCLSGCKSLVALPDAIGELGALKSLDLSDCESLEALPDAISGLGALTTLDLSQCKKLVALPDAIGELGALKSLDLRGCESLAALPAAIGELGALTELSLFYCTKLAALPDTIGGLSALTRLNVQWCTSLAALPAAIGELKALKELDLSECPSLVALPAAIGKLKALVRLYLSKCSKIAALPESIGELKALVRLYLSECSKLAALPESIGELKALTVLKLDGCSSLSFPPLRMHEDVEMVKRCFASVGPILDGALALEDAGADEREFFFADVLKHPAYADRLGARVRKNPAFADLTNDKGQRVVELACFECRAQMQKALFLLGRYAVDKTPPLHFSATAAVLGATDHDKSDVKPRRALKAMRRVDQVLAELEGRAGLDSRFVVAIVAVHVSATVSAADYDEVAAAASKLDGVVVERASGLGEDLAGLLAAREQQNDASAGRFMGYDYLLIMELAEESLSKKIIHGGVCGVDLVEIRKIAREMAEALDHLHLKGRIHADLKPLNVVRVGTTWQLVDLDVSCAIGDPFGTKKPSLGYCPPEMAQTILDAMDASDRLDTARLGAYTADKAYDLWSLGVVLFHLATGTPLWKTDKNDDTSPKGLRKLVSRCFDLDRKLAVAAPRPTDDFDGDLQMLAFDLIRKLLTPEPDERLKAFPKGATPMRGVLKHGFFSNERGAAGRGDAGVDDEVMKVIAEVRASQAQILRSVNAVRDLGEEHRDELRATGKSLRKAILEASEVKTPTAFVVLKNKLPPLEEDEQLRVKVKEDGEVVVGGALPDEVNHRVKQAKAWLKFCSECAEGVAKCSTKAIAGAAKGSPECVKDLKEAAGDLLVGNEMWFYLIDELTGEPVRSADGVYPIRITEPSELVGKLLPVMQVGLHAASLVNGVSGVVRMFGYPFPSVPEKLREGAERSVEVLKQESSVEKFGVIQEHVETQDEQATSVRGASLRELEKFLAKEDPRGSYAGLQKVGDDSDGTAVWTTLTDPEEVQEALKTRAASRRAERRLQEAASLVMLKAKFASKLRDAVEAMRGEKDGV